MKKLMIISLFLLLSIFQTNAQVGINTDNSAPHQSAMLDVKSSNQGLLPPRMTFTELNAITGPAEGLIVYCTDCGADGHGALAMFINGMWFTMNANCMLPAFPSAGTHIPAATQITWKWNDVPAASGYKWNTTNDYASAINMATATSKTENGLTCNTPYTRYVWACNACGNSTPATLTQSTAPDPPAVPVAGTHVPSASQIEWKWNAVPNATGYKWSISNDYSSAMDIGNVLSLIQSGLVCEMTYNLFLWAYSPCGVSAPATFTQMTALCANPIIPCPGTPTVTHGGKQYNTVKIGTQCWFKENLDIGNRIDGAVEQTDNDIIEKYCYNDLDANCTTYGGLYQWTEMMQYSYIIKQGLCPSGWHVPVESEWYDLVSYLGTEPGGKLKEAGYTHWIEPNTGATNSSGFTALPGGLLYPNKQYSELTEDCYIWSSSPTGAAASHKTLRYTTGNVETYNNEQTYSFSVRCLKDTCTTYSTASVSVGASSTSVCAGTLVTFTATPDNGGTNPVYQWKVNNVNAGSNSTTHTYAPANGDAVTCVMTSTLPCVNSNPATSNTVSMTVNPVLPVSITIAASANPVSAGTPVTFTATAVNGGTYQWKVNWLDVGTSFYNYTYTPANGDVVICIATSYLPCTSNNPATSNAITMQVAAPAAPCPGTPTVTYGSKTYNTVQIGTQCWFKENLNIGMKIPGTHEQSNNELLEKYCYNDLEANCDIYGGLYQWAELVQYLNGATNTTSWDPVPTGNVQGICPDGWHLPSNAEWIHLADYLGGATVASGKMKEIGFTHWQSPNTDATNSSGFTALGCGHRYLDGAFWVQLQYTNYWSTTEVSAEFPWTRALGNISGELWSDSNYAKSMGYSTRCVKN